MVNISRGLYLQLFVCIEISLVLACVYVYSDSIMSRQKPPPLPARVCFYSGCYTTVISLVWIGFYTLPRYDDLIHIKPGTSNQAVISMYILVSVSNALHSWNYYELIDRTGSVSFHMKMIIFMGKILIYSYTY